MLARKMVCDWGMSEKLGPLSFGGRDDEVFIGRDFAKRRDYSEATAQEIDNEIKRVLIEAEEKATRLLSENIDKLELLAEALLEQEILDGNEIDEILGIKAEKEEREAETAAEKQSNPGEDSDE